MSDTYLRLSAPWLNLRFSLALTICEPLALFFVSSYFDGLLICNDALHKLGSLHAS